MRGWMLSPSFRVLWPKSSKQRAIREASGLSRGLQRLEVGLVVLVERHAVDVVVAQTEVQRHPVVHAPVVLDVQGVQVERDVDVRGAALERDVADGGASASRRSA